MQTNTLNTQQKSLRGVAHHLDPVVAVSERGLSQGIVDETERALNDHELIKIKVFGIDRASRDEIASELAEKTSSTVLQKISKSPYFTDTTQRPIRSFRGQYLEQSDT